MKSPTQTIIRMSGEKMEVLLEAGCVTRCAPGIAGRLPGIMRRLCRSLAKREVARFFIHDVRIGETAALVDRVNGCTYRVRMDAHAVRVLEVYENNSRPTDSANVVYLVSWGALRAVPGGKAVAGSTEWRR